MNKKVLKRFNLEDSVAGGTLKTRLGNSLELEDISLQANQEGYIIHIKYSKEDRKYKFSVYEKKK